MIIRSREELEEKFANTYGISDVDYYEGEYTALTLYKHHRNHPNQILSSGVINPDKYIINEASGSPIDLTLLRHPLTNTWHCTECYDNEDDDWYVIFSPDNTLYPFVKPISQKVVSISYDPLDVLELLNEVIKEEHYITAAIQDPTDEDEDDPRIESIPCHYLNSFIESNKAPVLEDESLVKYFLVPNGTSKGLDTRDVMFIYHDILNVYFCNAAKFTLEDGTTFVSVIGELNRCLI